MILHSFSVGHIWIIGFSSGIFSPLSPDNSLKGSVIDASCDLSKGQGSVSAGLTANKWCLVNKLSYCFNSCSLIEFTEWSPSQGSAGEELGGGAGAEVAWCGMGMHLVLFSCYPATSLAPLDSNCISAAHRLTGLLRLSADSKSSFYLSAKRNKVVLNWVGRVCLACLLVLVWTKWRWARDYILWLWKVQTEGNWVEKNVDLNPGCSLAAPRQKINAKLEKIWKKMYSTWGSSTPTLCSIQRT